MITSRVILQLQFSDEEVNFSYLLCKKVILLGQVSWYYRYFLFLYIKQFFFNVTLNCRKRHVSGIRWIMTVAVFSANKKSSFCLYFKYKITPQIKLKLIILQLSARIILAISLVLYLGSNWKYKHFPNEIIVSVWWIKSRRWLQ